MSGALEAGLGVGEGAGPGTFVLVAFAARARRLLRSAYRLIDAGERDAAVPLYRVMSEYLIVGRWLMTVGVEDLQLWALDDLRGRLTVLRAVIADSGLDDATRETLGEEVARTEEAIRGYGGDDEPVTKRAAKKAGYTPPSVEAMAKLAGVGFSYRYFYRLASQTDVHATAVAADQAYDADPANHGHVLRPIPRFALEHHESYTVGAHLLLDILRPLVDLIPQLRWDRTTNMIEDVLRAVGRADPEHAEDATTS